MVFNSWFFIFVYLPVLLLGRFGLNRVNHRAADVFLIGMSLWFYGCFGWENLAVLLVSIVMNYTIGCRIEGKRWLLAAGIAANLVLLSWFKYAADVITAAGEFAGTDSSLLPAFMTLALPVGLSFYTFTQISYLIDRCRAEIAQDSFLIYVLYASYFPKLIEGPITRYEEITSQLKDDSLRRFDAENFTRGLILFIFGLGKKVLIADVLSPSVTYALESVYYLDTLSVIVTMTGYILQLYMDFSGFCDMAMGISRMLNIRLPLNFDAPLRSVSYSDLWHRWHMSLNRFFTRYIYIPLGGSRRGTLWTFVNTILVFLLSGLWHGTGANYLVWGAVCGLLVFLSNRYEKMHPANLRPTVRESGTGRHPFLQDPGWKRLRTIVIFALSMTFFAASSLNDALIMFRQLLVPRFPGWLYRMAGQLDASEFWVINKAISLLLPSLENPAALAELLLVITAALILVLQPKTAAMISESITLSTRNAVLIGILAVWCLTSLSGVSTFMYFQY